MHKHKSLRLLLALVVLLLAACDLTNLPSPSATQVAPTVTAQATVTPAPTDTIVVVAPTITPEAATATAVPATGTPASTDTPQPTSAAQPTAAQATPALSTPAAKAGTQGCPAALMPQVPRDSIGDDLYPNLGNAGYDVQHYDINLSVDVAKNNISGTTTINLRPLQDLTAFNLDFHGLNISSLTVDGVQAKPTLQNGELTITPPSTLKQGKDYTVAVSYSGVPNSDQKAGGALPEGWTRSTGGIFVAGEPTGASSWYPVNDHPCDKATYTFHITVPRPYVVAANGILSDTIDLGSKTTYVSNMRDPAASYLVTVNIGQFDRVEEQGPDGLPLRFYFPKTLDTASRKAFEQTPELISYFSSIFGPFPFETYGAVVIDSNLSFALETQTMSLYGRNVGLGRANALEVIAHETAHQWFGDSVSLEDWKDIWLNEGFATYAQWLWLEHTDGTTAYNSRVKDTYASLDLSAPPPPGDPPSSDLFNQGVYLRGGLVLHALRKQIGDDAFFRTLRTYADRYRYGNANTQEFISVAEEVSGQKVSDLMQKWLYDEKMPPLP